VEISDQSGLSAESVAILLLKKFSEKQLPKASDLEWLVPLSEAPQEVGDLDNINRLWDIMKSGLYHILIVN
jgi:hypothetical protein